MEWNKKNTMYFIQLIRERPAIWEATELKNKQKKVAALSEISKIIGLTKNEVNLKWISLKGQYVREKKKVNGLTGSGATENYISKWFAYQEMSSLMTSSVPQDSTSNSGENSNRQKPTCFVSVNQEREAQISQSRLQGDGIRTERPAFKHRVNILRPKERKSPERDEYATYGELVAMKLKKIASPYARSTAQYHINNILYKAEIGEYDKPPRERNCYILKDHFSAGSSSAHNDSNYDVHSQRSSSPAKSMEFDVKYEEIEELDE